MTDFVIYAVSIESKQDVKFTIKKCKKPSTTKIYKEYELGFDEGIYQEYGAVSLDRLLKEGLWLTHYVQLSEKDLK